jgi:uncharacterized protein
VKVGMLRAGIAAALVLLISNGPTRAEPIAPTVLHLTQTAESKVVPDLLRVVLLVEEQGASPLVVQAAINRRMAAALDRARQVMGIAVETGGYSVDEEEPHHGSPRWHGSQSLILSGTSADVVLKLTGALQAQGLVVSSMQYAVSPETVRGAEEDLTAAAIAGLGERAAEIAGRLHLKVLGYRDLRVGNAETGPPPLPRFAMAMAAPAPVAAPGEATVRLSIEAEILLGRPPSRATP